MLRLEHALISADGRTHAPWQVLGTAGHVLQVAAGFLNTTRLISGAVPLSVQVAKHETCQRRHSGSKSHAWATDRVVRWPDGRKQGLPAALERITLQLVARRHERVGVSVEGRVALRGHTARAH